MQYPTFARDHFADIAAYENSVLDGTRPACQWERLAVQRQIDDLIAANEDKNFPYYFDFEKALEPIRFIECFSHVKGRWARGRGEASLIVLEPWQKFIIAVLFGWRRKESGLRRFSLAYVCVPRKNGKSILSAGIGLFMLAADDESGAEVYCGATTERQAWEVFRPAKKMAQKNPFFLQHYDLEVRAKSIYRAEDESRFEPVIGSPGDGSSPSFWVCDEYHEHKTDHMVETMESGQGAREHGLGLIITTAGDNHEGPCFAAEEELKNVLTGAANDETYFGIIYTIDKDVDWKTERALIMANPNYGVSVDPIDLKARQKRAINNVRKQANFKNKRLDVWVSSRSAWLNPEDIKAATDENFIIEDFHGLEAGLGADLSESKDLTAFVKCFKKKIDAKEHYYFTGRFYTTEKQAAENPRYSQWVHDGHLIAGDGSMIDYELIADDVKKDDQLFSISRCFFDPKGAAVISQQIEAKHDIQAVRFEQSYTNFSPVMKDFEALLLDGRIHFENNPCFIWMIENIIAKKTMDGKDFRPVKASDAKKIDGGVAALMAFASIYNHEEEKEAHYSIYNDSDLSDDDDDE